MKNKYILYFFCLAFLSSCSKDDMDFTINIQADCPNGSNTTPYCVSKDTYNDVKSRVESLSQGCKSVSFQDLSGTTRSGFYVGQSSGAGACG